MPIQSNQLFKTCTDASETVTSFPRSPLRYPGGKSRAVQYILPLIPAHEKKLCAPFLGGASIELACATRMQVFGSDCFAPLINFWQVLLQHPEALAEKVKQYYPLSRTAFYVLKENYFMLSVKIKQAAAFYVLNRTSFAGLTLSGGMQKEHPRFNPAAIEQLRTFCVHNFSVACMDYREAIAQHTDSFLYLDPPFMTKYYLYGYKGNTYKGFDHAALAAILKGRGRWILSYNDCPEIRTLYKEYTMLPVSWQYSLPKQKQAHEVLILSHDVHLPK